MKKQDECKHPSKRLSAFLLGATGLRPELSWMRTIMKVSQSMMPVGRPLPWGWRLEGLGIHQAADGFCEGGTGGGKGGWAIGYTDGAPMRLLGTSLEVDSDLRSR